MKRPTVKKKLAELYGTRPGELQVPQLGESKSRLKFLYSDRSSKFYVLIVSTEGSPPGQSS